MRYVILVMNKRILINWLIDSQFPLYESTFQWGWNVSTHTQIDRKNKSFQLVQTIRKKITTL